MNRMAATDIVIHKGEKEEKYQLYVEDYVMSYLKKYRDTEGENIFFYGKRAGNGKKYYIYGAGKQKEITYFSQYALLEEVTCRIVMDMPAFSIRKNDKTYELSGYDIFYQSNEAMQNYMVEQRKEMQYQTKTETKTGVKAQTKAEIRDRGGEQKLIEMQRRRESVQKAGEKKKNGLMTIQLCAVFVILIAIVINSTNSYHKLEELNQAAVEVFFAMENQEAAQNDVSDKEAQTKNAQVKNDDSAEADIPTEGTILRLSDLDEKFEEENRAVKQEETETEEEGIKAGEDETAENAREETEQKESARANEQEKSLIEEALPSKQAFGRTFAEYYQIEKGDTLYNISIKIYGDTSKVNAICELNQIKDPDNIKYGQKILLP